jgi:hypothetical protein
VGLKVTDKQAQAVRCPHLWVILQFGKQGFYLPPLPLRLGKLGCVRYSE